MRKTDLREVTFLEWSKYAKEQAKQIIENGKSDGRKRRIGDYNHKSLNLRFGKAIDPEENELRHRWYDLVDEELEKLKK